MRTRSASGATPETGMAAITLIVAAALSLIVFVSLANIVTMVFTRTAVRAAIDEAVRAGSRSDTPIAECEARARAVLGGLLGPPARRGVVLTCSIDTAPPAVRARAEVALTPWWPGLPTWTYAVETAAVREELP